MVRTELTSIQIRKVAEDLRGYTCDAMAGKELYSDPKAMALAKKRIKEAEIVFTTCIGSAIGLLRTQEFQIVIVDEASQQTEPASLVPLVKGCSKAILVGDHVQLRPTVQQYALSVGFDVSLFERLYTGAPAATEDDHRKNNPDMNGVRRLMLDTQYRMHPLVGAFSSEEFYEGKLKTGITAESRPLFASRFPWPKVQSTDTGATEYHRTVFVECGAKEKPGQKSKENEGQALLCAHICKLLTQAAEGPPPQTPPADKRRNLTADPQSIAVLTPYARQAELLRRYLSVFPEVEVSSIDGFQGREADVVVFGTVRCNERGEIGFLRDLRRMNVVLTRARCGLVVVGHGDTLKGGEEEESTGMWRRLMDGLASVAIETPDLSAGRKEG